MRKVYISLEERKGAKERLEDLREMRNSNYENMSFEREFARKVELVFAEAQLNPDKYNL